MLGAIALGGGDLIVVSDLLMFLFVLSFFVLTSDFDSDLELLLLVLVLVLLFVLLLVLFVLLLTF